MPRRTLSLEPSQPVFAESGFKDSPHPLRVGFLHPLAAQQIAPPGVGHGQRIDAGSVATAEPALEVGAPDAVGLSGMRQRLGMRRGPPPLPEPRHLA